MDLTHLDTWLKVLLSVVVTAGALLAGLKPMREAFLKCFKTVHYYLTIGDVVLKRLDDFTQSCKAEFTTLATDVGFLKEQTSFNGGKSMRDAVNRLEAHRGFDFLSRPYPAFECSRDGENLMVTEAYGRLLGISSDFHLRGRNWIQFVHEEDQDNYTEKCAEAMKARTVIRLKARFQDFHGEPVGLWEVIAYPVGSEAARLEYVGRLFPVNDLARAKAVQHHIQ